jgi:hypothetical protein
MAMKKTAIIKTFALLLLATAMTLGTKVEAKNPNPTPCTFSNKVRSDGISQAEWDLENAIYRKFVEGYVIEKQRYDKSNPIDFDRIPSKGKERENFFAARVLEIDRQYKNRIMAEDPSFYRIIENGPHEWYTEENKEVWRNILWEYMAPIGYYKEVIMFHADTGKDSLANTIALTKTWPVGSSREAARTKKITLESTQETRSYLHRQIKRLDGLVCRGAWFSSWYYVIYEESNKAYLKAIDVQRNNADVVDQKRNEQAAMENRIQSNQTWTTAPMTDNQRVYYDCMKRFRKIYGGHMGSGMEAQYCGGPPIN